MLRKSSALILAVLLLNACATAPITATASVIPTATPTASPTVTPTPTHTVTPTSAITPEPPLPEIIQQYVAQGADPATYRIEQLADGTTHLTFMPEQTMSEAELLAAVNKACLYTKCIRLSDAGFPSIFFDGVSQGIGEIIVDKDGKLQSINLNAVTTRNHQSTEKSTIVLFGDADIVFKHLDLSSNPGIEELLSRFSPGKAVNVVVLSFSSNPKSDFYKRNIEKYFTEEYKNLLKQWFNEGLSEEVIKDKFFRLFVVG